MAKAQRKSTSINPQSAQKGSGQGSATQVALSLPAWTPWAIVAITGLVYFRSLFNGLTGLDDDFYITNNPDIAHFSVDGIRVLITSFYCGNYHPLTMLALGAIYKFFHASPFPYHLLNMLLHLANTWLVYKLCLRLSRKEVTAAVVSLLFGIHPMHVESVAWASELKDVLYSLFYLLALIAYLDYGEKGYKWATYGKVLLFFFASLCAKPAAVTLPALLLVVDFYCGRKPDLRMFLEKIPAFAFSLLFGIMAIIAQRQGGAYNGLMVSYGLFNSCTLFLSGLSFYFIWLLAPLKLSSFHYFPEVQGHFLPFIYYLSLPAIACIGWLVLRKGRYRKEIWFGVVFFLVAISVMLQVVSVGSALTSERYTYIGYIGLFYIGGQILADKALIEKYRQKIVWGFIIYSSALAIMSWNRIGVWHDDNTLFNDLVEKNPDFYYGYWLRGNTEKSEGDLQEALADYTRCISLNGKFEDAYYNCGIIEDALHDKVAALRDYDSAIKINPNQADSYNNRGWVYFQLGDTAAAIADYKTALVRNPRFAEAYNNMGWAYERAGKADEALRCYTIAVADKPGYLRPLANRALLYLNTGSFAKAVTDYNKLISEEPGNGAFYYLRGSAYYGTKDVQHACADWQTAVGMGNKDAAASLARYCK